MVKKNKEENKEEVEKSKEDQATTKEERQEKKEENQTITISLKELEEIKLRVEDINNKYLRSLADLENVKRRALEEKETTNKYAITKFARELLSVSDIFKKAFVGIEEEEIEDTQFKNFFIGIKLTNQELEKTLKSFGIEKMDVIDKKFDANFHEALFVKEDSEKEDNTIIEIIEDGYMISDRLLRAAKVGIVKN